MSAASIKRKCIVCNKPIIGRADKKFCDIGCRNNFNNQLNAVTNNHIRNINNALRKNRRILENFLLHNTDKTVVPRDLLLQCGFFMQYFTQLVNTSEGNTCVLCYEYGYILHKNNQVEIVKKENLLESEPV